MHRLETTNATVDATRILNEAYSVLVLTRVTDARATERRLKLREPEVM